MDIDQEGKVHGRFAATGIRPHFFEAFEANDIAIPDIFLGGS